ncbi:DUF4337 domain-containing protein [uncultured Gammaproteobacteria bacterium]
MAEAHEAHEIHERIEHAAGHGHGHSQSGSKRSLNSWIGLLVAVLAALLAVVETGAKSAQTKVFTQSIETNDLWSFFQAKTIRSAVLASAADSLELTLPTDPKAQKRVEDWRKAVARLESDPEKGEGRKELIKRAQAAGAERDHQLHALHRFEYGSAALQLGIVISSSSLVLGTPFLAVLGAMVGATGFVTGVSAWYMDSAGEHH